MKNSAFLILFALIVPAIVVFHRLGEAPLAGDDCYYSQVSKEMSNTGDYLTPRNSGRVDFHTSKPPMLFWMNALSGNIFGFNSFAMRLPSALLGYIGVIALFFFARRYFGLETAFLSSLILTFTQQYLYHARSAVTDGPFAVFFALSLFAFWAARTENRSAFYYLWGFFLAAAVMTRQLPGFFIYAVVAAYIILSKEFKILKKPHFYGAAALSLVLIVPWHVIMYQKYGEGFLKQYFGVTLMTGITGYPAGYSSSASLNPWYAYYEIMLSNYEPWLIFTLIGFYKIIRHFKTYGEERGKTLLFLLCWSLAPLAIFQAAKVKQYHYIVPLYAAFGLIAAFAIAGFAEKTKRVIITGLLLLVSGLTVSYIFYPVIPKTLDSREYVENLKLAEELKKMEGDVYILKHGSSYFNNCFLFYADKLSLPRTEEDLAAMINSQEKRNFAVLKEDMPALEKRLSRPVNIIKESQDSLLFTN